MQCLTAECVYGMPHAPRDVPAVVSELLVAKLTPPRVPGGVVARPRLIEALDAGAELGVTGVCAPAGYGKTLLLAAWCADRVERGAAPAAWLSLAATENDPGLLLRYLIGALRRAGIEVGQRAAKMVQAPGASPFACLRSVLNDLAALPQRPTLVLDDYHVITEAVCHELIALLVDHGDLSLRVIFCTQADPPLALGSLRAAGQLSELRADDLRFSTDEARELMLSASDGLALDPDTVATLASGLRAGPPGCIWPPCGCVGAAANRPMRSASAATTAMSWTISARRSWRDSTTEPASFC